MPKNMHEVKWRCIFSPRHQVIHKKFAKEVSENESGTYSTHITYIQK